MQGKSEGLGEDFAARLEKAMRARGFTQASLSRALLVSQATVSRWLSGRFTPGERLLRDLAVSLRTTQEWLLRGEGEMDSAVQRAALAEAEMPYKNTRVAENAPDGDIGGVIQHMGFDAVCDLMQALLMEVRKAGRARMTNLNRMQEVLDELVRREWVASKRPGDAPEIEPGEE